MHSIVVRAELNSTGLWSPDGEPLSAAGLSLSDRLIAAIADWIAFYNEVDGVLEDVGVRDEFLGQSYKIAHGIRRELKGSVVWLCRVGTGDLVSIELSRLR